ncbi:MAG: LysR family transcriptional regulator [Lachnospiraceae bacterium]|nr:LysR family transcriptional regulator [Lachnospiraceae bacterium]
MEQNFNLYHTFYIVATCGSISGAAKQLYISQPAISKSINKLEQHLQLSLFYRTSKGVTLTAEGEILYKQVATAFQALKQGEQKARQAAALGIGSISIGVSTTLCKYILLPYLQNFIAQNPHIKISISCQSTNQTVAALKNGSIDIGLIGEIPTQDELFFYPIQEIEDVFVTTESYMQNLQARNELSERSLLSNATLMLLDKQNLTRQYIDIYLSNQNIASEQLIEVTTLDLLIEFAKIGLGIACVIKDFVKEELTDGTLIQLPLNTPIPKRKIGFAYHTSANPNPAIQKFIAEFIS